MIPGHVVIHWKQESLLCLEGGMLFSPIVLILRKRYYPLPFCNGEIEVQGLTDQTYRVSHLEANNWTQIHRLLHLCVFNHRNILFLFFSLWMTLYIKGSCQALWSQNMTYFDFGSFLLWKFTAWHFSKMSVLLTRKYLLNKKYPSMVRSKTIFKHTLCYVTAAWNAVLSVPVVGGSGDV